MKLHIERLFGLSLCCCAAAAITACGGGNSSNSGTAAGTAGSNGVAAVAAEPSATTSASVSAVASATKVLSKAPPPDSASVNGDVSLRTLKAAQSASRGIAATAAPEDSGTALVHALGVERSTTPAVTPISPRKVDRPISLGVDPNIIYVSTNGDDGWSGSLPAPNATRTDGPVRTLPAAQLLARARVAAMAAGAVRAPIRVRITAGDYYLTAPLEFTPADSGTADAMVYYEAITAGTVTISGGVPLNRSAGDAPAGQVRFDVPAVAGTSWKGGSQLFVNDQRAVLARQPNAGQYWFVKNRVALPSEGDSDNGREAFTTSADALAWINGLSAADRSRAVINVMQSWTDGHHRLSTAATPAGTVRLTPRAASPFLQWGLSQRTYVENVAAALDAPGEWLWDANGVRYIPTANQAAASVNAVMPVLDKLVVIKGDFASSRWVQNLWFSGLSFAHTRYLVPDEGLIDSQAGRDVGAAIEVDGAVGLVIDNCNVSHTSGYGLWLRRGVRDSRVTNTSFSDMGAGGIKMGLPQQWANELATGANSAVGNRISDTGKLFSGSVGIWLGQGFDNLVANNAIMNTTYTGISVGWSWGYGSVTSGRNRILDNLLVNIGMGHLSDLGGIYTVGMSPGTVISGNVVREVRSYPGYGPGGWGIYNDEGASNLLVENNLVVGTDSGGYHLNYGRDNTVRNNLFALGGKFEMRVTNTDPQNTKLAFTNNLMVPLVQQPFDEYAHAPDVIFSGVQVSDKSAGMAIDLGKCGSGCSVVATTLTTGADPRDVVVAKADAATIARFADIARKSGPASLVSASTIVEVPQVPPVIVVAPPVPLELAIAGAAVGSQPEGMAYVPNNPAFISVIRDSTAPGGSCLAVNDSADLGWSFMPFFYTSLNHDRGTSTAEFSIKIDAKTVFGYEWRDGGNPYKSGPAITITPAGIVVKGQVLAAAPIGRWLTLRVMSAVDDPNATWTLDVTDNATGAKSTFNGLAFASTGWSKLMWMGFVSDATTASTACIGKLKVTSSIQ